MCKLRKNNELDIKKRLIPNNRAIHHRKQPPHPLRQSPAIAQDKANPSDKPPHNTDRSHPCGSKTRSLILVLVLILVQLLVLVLVLVLLVLIIVLILVLERAERNPPPKKPYRSLSSGLSTF